MPSLWSKFVSGLILGGCLSAHAQVVYHWLEFGQGGVFRGIIDCNDEQIYLSGQLDREGHWDRSQGRCRVHIEVNSEGQVTIKATPEGQVADTTIKLVQDHSTFVVAGDRPLPGPNDPVPPPLNEPCAGIVQPSPACPRPPVNQMTIVPMGQATPTQLPVEPEGSPDIPAELKRGPHIPDIPAGPNLLHRP